MKKIFYFMLSVALLNSCYYGDEDKRLGRIYGIVTEKGTTAEPMRGTGVELYHDNSLLLRTTTYDDGHYEFDDLQAGSYKLIVEAAGYLKLTHNVVVEAGRIARADMQLEKVVIQTNMTVRTLDITNIGGNFATLNGAFSSSYNVSECGFVYATNSTPVNGGTRITASISNFSKTITDMVKGTYFVQAYATNSRGTEYGEVRSFQIIGNPSVTTLEATNATATTATLNGKIEYQGNPVYTEKGFVYSNTFQNPTIDDPVSSTTKFVVSGTSVDFSANIAGLTAETTYNVRAYATNSNGTVYGEAISFKPMAIVDYIVLQSEGIMVQKNDISSGSNWNTAKSLCESSRIGGYSDWRLPTDGELKTLYNNRNTVGGFSTAQTGSFYWSGTNSYGDTYYVTLNFSNGYYYTYYSGSMTYCYYTNSYRVRAVRTLP